MSPMQDNGDGRGRDALPPPAFPPGQRRGPVPTHRPEGGEDDVEGSVPDDAFIRPDQDEALDDAFIAPDAPVVRTGAPSVPEDFEEVMGRISAHGLSSGEIVVTGIGDDPHMNADPYMQRWGDPHLAQLMAAVTRLAQDLREEGEAGLQTEPGMSPFEATLRAYCVGYLGGLRDHEPDPGTP